MGLTVLGRLALGRVGWGLGLRGGLRDRGDGSEEVGYGVNRGREVVLLESVPGQSGVWTCMLPPGCVTAIQLKSKSAARN